MSDFSGFLEKAGVYAAKATDVAKSLASSMAKKTKNVSHIAKLNVDIAAKRDTIKLAYTEIGKLYYETHREDPEGFFVQLCQEIDAAMSSIRDMETEIAALKAKPEDDSVPGQEDSVSETEDDAGIEVEVTEDPEDSPADGEIHIDILSRSSDEEVFADTPAPSVISPEGSESEPDRQDG